MQERRKELAAASGAPYYDNDLVVAKPDGAPFRRDSVSTAFGQLIRHLELPHLRFHDLRHTYATMLYDAGVDVLTAQRLLGHADVQTTMRIYTHLSKQKEQQSIAALNAHIGSEIAAIKF